MNILITNDDGYKALGIKMLVEILKPLGNLTIVAPKKAQSGMSMAISMGFAPLAVKHVKSEPGEDWWYLDGTPVSCVKFGLDNVLYPVKPDVVISGINHGHNAATASIYSGTVGSAMEGSVNGVPSIAISLDSIHPEEKDFQVIRDYFPELLKKLLASPFKFGRFYNVNFPCLPSSEIKGTKVCSMGRAHWEREYREYSPEFIRTFGTEPTEKHLNYLKNLEEGENAYVMAGDFVDNGDNLPNADHLNIEAGYITITPGNIDNTDTTELSRLCDII